MLFFIFLFFRAVLAAELFFITGVPWIFEIVAWLPALRRYSSAKYFFEVVNLLNSLRGLFVFILFVLLRPTVLKFLMSRFKELTSSNKDEMQLAGRNSRQIALSNSMSMSVDESTVSSMD